MKSLIAATVIVILALALWVAYYLGAHKPVALTLEQAGPFRVVYQKHIGAYHKIVPAIEEVEKWARENNEPCRLSFGEYLDNVDTVAEDRLQSHAGCLVEKEWTSGLPEKFTYREIPERRYVVAEFEGAPSIGPMKVYPGAQEYIEESGLKSDGPVIEMYEIMPNRMVKTRYYFPVTDKPTDEATDRDTAI